MRALVSYDDLTDSKPQSVDSSPPPKKKQKLNRNSRRKSNGYSNGKVHPTQKSQSVKANQSRYAESRQLTHEEIWDDSALIAAWDAAAEEYEILNGPEKNWKKEPVVKAPLWFNIPPEQEDTDDSRVASTGMPSIPKSSDNMREEEENDDEDDSRPLDFETYIPRHDPSLSFSQGVDQTTFADVVPPQDLSHVSADTAFQNAMRSWYWAGYWTGIYHTTSRQNPKASSNDHQNDYGDEGQESVSDNEVEDENVDTAADQTDLIPT